MSIFCKELNKSFTTREDMFKELASHESKIVELKKAAIKESDAFAILFIDKSDATEKALSFVKEGYVYPVINTTNWYDSHGDVHFPGIWNKSIKDKAGKLFYVMEHKLSIDNVIAFPNDVKAFVKTLNWSDLNINKEGQTQALIYEIAKDKIKLPQVKSLFEEKVAFENSVRMRYITIALAMKSDNEDFAKQNALYKERIDLIANKEDAEESGYFWAVDEASIEKEGSLCLFGSNSATPVIYEAAASTSEKTEPLVDSTQTEEQKINYDILNY